MRRLIWFTLGLLSFVPAFAVCLGIVTAIAMPWLVGPGEDLGLYGVVWTTVAWMAFLSAAVSMAAFVAHAIRINSDNKGWWVAGILIAPVVVLPLYWLVIRPWGSPRERLRDGSRKTA